MSHAVVPRWPDPPTPTPLIQPLNYFHKHAHSTNSMQGNFCDNPAFPLTDNFHSFQMPPINLYWKLNLDAG